MAKKNLKPKEEPQSAPPKEDSSKQPHTRTLMAYKKTIPFEKPKPLLISLILSFIGVLLILLTLHYWGFLNFLFRDVFTQISK